MAPVSSHNLIYIFLDNCIKHLYRKYNVTIIIEQNNNKFQISVVNSGEISFSFNSIRFLTKTLQQFSYGHCNNS